MHFLRHNRLWLALALAAAMVFTLGVSPAAAVACVLQDGPACAVTAAPEPASQSCAVMGKPGSCCCGPGEKPTAAASAPKAGLSGCDCTLEAPAPDQPDARVGAFLVPHGAAALPAVPLSVLLPERGSWTGPAAADVPPRAPWVSSGASRAPPAS